MMDEAAIPRLLRGVRRHHDRVRGKQVLLAPERVFVLDPISDAVLETVDGERSFGSIVDTLAARYNAPRERIAEDAGKLLKTLIDRRLMETA
ncbi:MAG: pyrroloquinoline quinone biosynthesis peptide chaperone PqqD [Pseudomonadota bacterium]